MAPPAESTMHHRRVPCVGTIISNHSSSVNNTHTKPEQPLERVIHEAELSLHNKQGDAWVAIRGKVYDVSQFAEVHPGGAVIYTHAGRDATDAFTAFHSGSAWDRLPGLCVGRLQERPDPVLVRDFRALRSEMLRRGMFRSSKPFYALKIGTTLLLLAAGLAVTWAGRGSSNFFLLLGAALVGLCWQQCGWLSHDFLHHQVFQSRDLNATVGGLFIGCFVLGFSANWWKAKHNTHHAAPNECDDAYNAVDPDIDTLPLLAWSKEIMCTVHSKLLRRLLRWQRELFFPMLLFARVAWLHASLSYAFSSQAPASSRTAERAALAGHYAWQFGFLLAAALTPGQTLLWLFTAHSVASIFLAIVFVQSHNGMEIYNDRKDFFTAQIISTRDVQISVFNDWFTGGLNRQIEHHLFPTMPRHHLKEASRMVQALCEKHGLVYEDVDWVTGTSSVLRHLAEVAATA